MKIFNRVFLVLFLSVLIVSCDSSEIYQNWQDIKIYQWKRDNVITNKVNIEDIDKNYKLSIGLRYLPSINEKEIKLVMGIVSPKGETVQKSYTVKLKNDEGEHLGEVMGQVADIKQVVEENYTFKEKGEYTFNIAQAMPNDPQGGIGEVGLLINKKE